MQNRFVLLDTDVMPICMINALHIVMNLRFSINCSIVICPPSLLSKLWPRGLFLIIYFQVYKPKNPKIFYLLFSFIYLYQISPLQVTVKGLTTPLSRWVQVFDCLCRYCWFACSFSTGLIPWFLTEGNTYLYFAASPFPLQGKNNASSRSSNKQIAGPTD